MSYIYKFKSGNTNDITALLQDGLWVSNYDFLNDPIDFPIYVNPTVDVSIEVIEEYINYFRKSHCCMSFSKKINNKRLWDYYTNGMKGMAIAYDYAVIRSALEQIGIKTKPISKHKRSLNTMNYDVAIEGTVMYDGAKVDLTELFTNDKADHAIEDEAFFHKDDSWQDESEYRFVFDFKDYNKPGFMLYNMTPSHIFIGNRMTSEDKNNIKDYCLKKGINLYEYRANYNSKNCKQYIRKALYNTNTEVIEKEWPQTLK